MDDLERAKKMYAAWCQAEEQAANGKSYTIEGRALTYQDMATITKQQNKWLDIIQTLSGGRGSRRISRVVLVDL